MPGFFKTVKKDYREIIQFLTTEALNVWIEEKSYMLRMS